MDEQKSESVSETPHPDWHTTRHTNWQGERALHRFSINGLPAVLLIGLAVIVLAGPVMHLALFGVKLALTLLPFVIVGGLLFWGFRSLMFMTVGGPRMRGHWHQHDRHNWRMRHWAEHRHGGIDDESHANRKDMDGIFYV